MLFASDHLVSQTGLVCWHKYKAGSSANNFIEDLSGNKRDLGCNPINSPVLSAMDNGKMGWVFDGSDEPLEAVFGNHTAYHFFVVGSHHDAAFAAYQGLMSGRTTGDVLISNNTGVNFFDYTGTYGTIGYRKANVSYANATQSAPMNDVNSVIEVIMPGGLLMDGLKIGQQRTLSGRLWEGKYLESIVYNRVLSDSERMRMYQYFAKMYHIWEKSTSAGPNIFPFTNNWNSPEVRKKRVLADEAEDGSMTYRTKRGKKRYLDLEFTRRTADELQASEQFYDEHHPGIEFVYRDRTVYPHEDLTVRFPPEAELEDVPGSPTGFSYKLKMNEV
jgi:hypothetical protein